MGVMVGFMGFIGSRIHKLLGVPGYGFVGGFFTYYLGFRVRV